MDSKSSITAPVNSTTSDKVNGTSCYCCPNDSQKEYCHKTMRECRSNRVTCNPKFPPAPSTSIVMQSRLHRVDRCMEQARTAMLMSSTIKKIKINLDVLPLFLKGWIPRIRASQTFLSLTNFTEKSINIYDIK
jgi:hypothetical protein